MAFSDEATARTGEETQPPPAHIRTELEYVMDGATYYDLRHPWFESP